MRLNEITSGDQIYLGGEYYMELKSRDGEYVTYTIHTFAEDNAGYAMQANIWFDPHWTMKIGYGIMQQTIRHEQVLDTEKFIEWCRQSLQPILDKNAE